MAPSLARSAKRSDREETSILITHTRVQIGKLRFSYDANPAEASYNEVMRLEFYSPPLDAR